MLGASYSLHLAVRLANSGSPGRTIDAPGDNSWPRLARIPALSDILLSLSSYDTHPVSIVRVEAKQIRIYTLKEMEEIKILIK